MVKPVGGGAVKCCATMGVAITETVDGALHQDPVIVVLGGDEIVASVPVLGLIRLPTFRVVTPGAPSVHALVTEPVIVKTPLGSALAATGAARTARAAIINSRRAIRPSY